MVVLLDCNNGKDESVKEMHDESAMDFTPSTPLKSS